MAMISTSNLVQSNKPLHLPVLALITIFLTQLEHRVNSLDVLSFTFDGFYPHQENLIFQGDATVDPKSDAIRLTRVQPNGRPLNDRVGRVIYSAPIHLWDSSSGNVANFETKFEFRITRTSFGQSPGDGITFFLANPDTTIPYGSSGRLLGLFSRYANPRNNSSNNNKQSTTVEEDQLKFKAASSSDKVVAVEFDTFPNTQPGEFDPTYQHIGIDINSIRSSVTAKWNYRSGEIATVYITYNAATTTLSVTSDYPSSSSTLSYPIALNTVLPQWVRIGLSASTGDFTQISEILKWSFTSTLGSLKREDPHIASIV